LEGHTYPAQWKKQGKRFVVHLAADAAVRGVDEDFDGACEELCMAIAELTGDGEAVLDLLRPAPEPPGALRYLDPPLVAIGWNETATGEPWQDGLFEGGYCGTCESGIGPRTSRPLQVKTLPKGNIGGFYQRMSNFVLLSEGFLSLLHPAEREAVAPREVVAPRNAKRRFFEITGEPALRMVGVRGGKYWTLACLHCAACGYRQFSCSHPELPQSSADFIAREDLPEGLAHGFLLEDPLGRRRLCMRRARWSQLKRSPHAAGVLADRVHVLPDDEVEREPDLSAYVLAG
jgi:hypothetical protein